MPPKGSIGQVARVATTSTAASLPIFSPQPWIWREKNAPNNNQWSAPSTMAISRSWNDVDAFCRYILDYSVALNSEKNSNVKYPTLFIDIGINNIWNPNMVGAFASLPYQYIVFGTLDSMMLVLHGYPKSSPEMATFSKVLRHGSISKLFWSSYGTDELEKSPYAMFIGQNLGKAWCNLQLFFNMLEIHSVPTEPLPSSLDQLIDADKIPMWKRKSPNYTSKHLLPTTSTLSAEELKLGLSEFFSKVSLFRRIIKDPQPDLLWMNEEDEREFARYYTTTEDIDGNKL